MKYTAPQTTYRTRTRQAAQRAFTLLELLVVIALTAVLIILIFKPLTDSINLTNRAGTQIESQTAAREILREITTELASAAAVYDNSKPEAKVNLWLSDKTGAPFVYPAQYAKIDYVMAARQLENQSANGKYITDPTTGQQIQKDTDPQNIALSVTPGRTITREFLGSRDNTSGPDTSGAGTSGMPVVNPDAPTIVFHGYANRWEDPANTQLDNRISLFKAQVQAFILDPTGATKRFVPNIALFHTLNIDGVTHDNDPTNNNIIIDDPNFFYDTTRIKPVYAPPGTDITADDIKKGGPPMWKCWRAVSHSLLPLLKADLVGLARDSSNNIVYDAANRPTVRLLASFTPTYVQNDPGLASSLENTGAETPYTAATQFTSTHGAWNTPYRVLVYRGATDKDDPLAQSPLNWYESDNKSGTGSANDFITHLGAGADVGPQMTVSPTGALIFNNPTPEMAFTVDPKRGAINFNFPQSVYVHDTTYTDVNDPNFPYPGVQNVTVPHAGASAVYFRPRDVNNTIFDPTYPDNPKRYIWLGAPSASLPWSNGNGAVLNPMEQIPTARVVPGSERIFGPDQRPGLHYGQRIQYARVSANVGVIGANQYKINYQDIGDVNNSSIANDVHVKAGYIEFDSSNDTASNPNFTGQEDPNLAQYRPHSLPQLQLDPTGIVVLAAPVEIYYQFQMNRPNDVVKIDYMTRDLMNVALEVRLYDPGSARPQDTQLASKVEVRNLQR